MTADSPVPLPSVTLTGTPEMSISTRMDSISGWGGHPVADARILEPLSASDCRLDSPSALIPRGLGRSYGDSANADTVLQTTYLNHFVKLDEAGGTVTVEGGVSINEILRLLVPRGWFLPVVPGTSHVTVGGAIASDIHGKNHHAVGTFCDHLQSVDIMLGSGEIVTVSPTAMPELFRATCGGMGLTGVIVRATIRLIGIPSSSIKQTTIRTSALEETFDAFETHSDAPYSVAWIDCMAKGGSLGRGLLLLGGHTEDGAARFESREMVSAPLHAPSSLLNRFSISGFNSLYYRVAGIRKEKKTPLGNFFFPLDAVGGWNKLYGKAGFFQYQFVVPKEGGLENMKAILHAIAESREGSFLVVLKQFGEANGNLLSFPMGGYTLALDFKRTPNSVALASRLDEMVLDFGGRIYLAKDALMTERTFKQSYPAWERFESVRAEYGAIGRFASHQSKRLGLG